MLPGYWSAHSDRDFEDPLGLNETPDDEEWDFDDPWVEAEMNCGRMTDGQCSQAGTEFCDFSCPFRELLADATTSNHLHDAIIALTRAVEHTRWGCSAQDYVHRVAADALRRAGRMDLATRCEEVDGPHGAARILAELEGTNGR